MHWYLIPLGLMFLIAVGSLTLTAFVVRKYLEQNRELVRISLAEKTVKVDQMEAIETRSKERERRQIMRDRWNPQGEDPDEDAAYNATMNART